MDAIKWGNLPDHIVCNILLHLTLTERVQAARVCKHWKSCFESHYLWKKFDFRFYSPEHSKCLTCVAQYGDVLQNVNIELDQCDKDNRKNACGVLNELAKVDQKKLQKLKIKFTGENPLFYAGKEFVNALGDLFGAATLQNSKYQGLRDVDLSGIDVAIDQNLINCLAANHPNLERLNIQNQILVCTISPDCILNLAEKCRKLKDLKVFHCSISEDVLLAFLEDNRMPLEHLGISCRREEKYGKIVTEDTWHSVAKKLPNLRITLAFDHTCLLHKVALIMKPSIPCEVLRLQTFTRIYNEINLASTYYANTLEKLVVNSAPSPELNQALIRVSTSCPRLNALHVFCVLDKSTVEQILEKCPTMKSNGTYTLKHVMESHPWIAGKNC